MEGKELLRKLVKQADNRVDILVGSGVDGEVIACLLKETGARSFHMSGKRALESKMVYQKEHVNMGIPGISEYTIFRTEEALIRQADRILKAFCEGEM